MVRGWLADHEWRVMVAALVMAGAAALGIGHEPTSPLGDGYSGIDLAGLAVLIASAGFAMGLRSRLSGPLAVRGSCRTRAAWLNVATLFLAASVVLSWGSREVGLARVVDLCATVGFVAGGLAILFSEGVALAYVFACAAVTVATPRSSGAHVPWWSLVLNEGGGAPRLVLSCLVIAAVSAVYVRGRRLLWDTDPW